MKVTKSKVKAWFTGLFVPLILTFMATSAHAVDGCKLLLCLGGNWGNIAECKPEVQEALNDMAKGKPFPPCTMSGAGNSGGNEWTTQSTCPAMYRKYSAKSGDYIGCTYPGRISVYINGALWSQVYWDYSGNTSTWYSDTARLQLTQGDPTPLDDKFITDLTQWNAQISQCTSGGGVPVIDQYGSFEQCKVPDTSTGG